MTGVAASAGMLALILDAPTALTGATEGIDLCIKTVIPALFPFFMLSALLTGSLTGTDISILRPLGKLCHIPKGAESLFLTGLLGGYPVGAQCISNACLSGQLNKEDASRMLGFCNNAGPAFIFGMSGFLFQRKSIPFILWMIQIASAIITGMVLPGGSAYQKIRSDSKQLKIGQVLRQSLFATATVCGWVVLFRVILSFCDRWYLWFFSPVTKVILTGILELTNGYIGLEVIQDDSLRFILASIFLSFGGICVGLQTSSVTSQAGLDLGFYFPGKAIQSALSILLSGIAAGYLFKTDAIPCFIPAAILLILLIILTRMKKTIISSSIPGSSVV